MWNPSPWAEQQGSFQNPVAPPSSQPCDAPLVCFSVNQQWLPYILGALLQLCQPTTWDVSTESDLQDILARAQDLLDCVGTAVPCVSAPPVLPGIGTSQRACNIAGYLANVLIKTSVQKAIDAYNNDNTLLDYGILIVGAIPDVGPLIPAIAQGLKDLYDSVFSGSLSDYQDALADTTLWSKITCAIYGAISADGQVTDSNFAALQAAVHAVGYTPTDVQSAIDTYLSDLGANAVENIQASGALAVYDCTSCGTGVSTGPAGLAIRQAAGTISRTIAAGTASATYALTFSEAFSVAPIVTACCEDAVIIASVSSRTTAGCVITITAAVPVVSDTTATVDWIAVVPGVN